MYQVFLICVLVQIHSCWSGEWLTTKGEFCIDKCAYHGDNYYYFWCHVADPSLHYTDGNFWGAWTYDDNSPDTHLKWDYCVPSVLERPAHEMQDLPNYNNQQAPSISGKPDYNPGSSHDTPQNPPDANQETSQNTFDPDQSYDFKQHTIQPKGPSTALYPFTACAGPCVQTGPRSACNVDTTHPLAFWNAYQRWFYCVDEKMPMRQQISGKYRLWCQDQCRREMRDHYWCNTLYGPDHCSPAPNVSSKGTKCTSKCEHFEDTFSEYYFCYTSPDESDWEYCGNFDVPQKKKTVVEFTRYDYVCADYCKEDDDGEYEWCYHVYWNYNSTTNTADLVKTWDYCWGHVPEGLSGWAIALIVIGVMGGIVSISLLFVFLTK